MSCSLTISELCGYCFTAIFWKNSFNLASKTITVAAFSIFFIIFLFIINKKNLLMSGKEVTEFLLCV